MSLTNTAYAMDDRIIRSNVWYVCDDPTAVYAEGYTQTRTEYHYTNVELDDIGGSSFSIRSGRKFGWGKVSAKTRKVNWRTEASGDFPYGVLAITKVYYGFK